MAARVTCDRCFVTYYVTVTAPRLRAGLIKECLAALTISYHDRVLAYSSVLYDLPILWSKEASSHCVLAEPPRYV